MRINDAHVHFFQHGYAECSGFTCAGLGLAYDVAALKQLGDGKNLNGGGFFKAHVGHGFKKFFTNREFVKTHAHAVP